MKEIERQIELLMEFINDGEMADALKDPFKGPHYVVGYLCGGIKAMAEDLEKERARASA